MQSTTADGHPRAVPGLAEAGDIISEYVSYGSMRTDDMFDSRFEALARLVPAHLRITPDYGFRWLTLTRPDHDLILRGESLTLRPRIFGSWTKNDLAAYRLGRARVARANDGETVVLVRKPLPHGCVIADVQAVYEALIWNVDGLECWSRYASWENEIIVRQPATLLTITISDVVRSHKPGDLTALAPTAGEHAYTSDGDSSIVIGTVPTEQPEAERGVWTVTNTRGDTTTVFWNDKQATWDIGDDPEAAREMRF